jgi:hypothetical protein
MIEQRMDSGIEVATGPQEQQYHKSGQERGRDHLLYHVFDGLLDEHRCIAQGRDLHARGQGLLDLWNLCFDPGHHLERRCIAGFEDLKQNSLLPVHQHCVRLRGTAKINIGHVANRDHSSIRLFDRQFVEGRDIHRRGVRLNQVVDGADFLVARRQHDVLLRQRVLHVLRGQSVSEQLVLI